MRRRGGKFDANSPASPRCLGHGLQEPIVVNAATVNGRDDRALIDTLPRYLGLETEFLHNHHTITRSRVL